MVVVVALRCEIHFDPLHACSMTVEEKNPLSETRMRMLMYCKNMLYRSIESISSF